jgi:lambda repressor-like predicted transcriptional regulator
LWLKVTLADNTVVYNPADIMAAVHERIASEKKPAGVLQKESNRVVLHITQLSDALSTLFNTYERMVSVTPKVRVSTAYKARFALLDSMKNKMLKEYASEYIPDELDNYILSDSEEREALIHRLCVVMVGKKEGEEVEEEVSAQ